MIQIYLYYYTIKYYKNLQVMKMIEKNGLKISSSLFNFINNEVIPDIKIDSEDFWDKFSANCITPGVRKFFSERAN